jgi:hypothetical protein
VLKGKVTRKKNALRHRAFLSDFSRQLSVGPHAFASSSHTPSQLASPAYLGSITLQFLLSSFCWRESFSRLSSFHSLRGASFSCRVWGDHRLTEAYVRRIRTAHVTLFHPLGAFDLYRPFCYLLIRLKQSAQVVQRLLACPSPAENEAQLLLLAPAAFRLTQPCIPLDTPSTRQALWRYEVAPLAPRLVVHGVLKPRLPPNHRW